MIKMFCDLPSNSLFILKDDIQKQKVNLYKKLDRNQGMYHRVLELTIKDDETIFSTIGPEPELSTLVIQID